MAALQPSTDILNKNSLKKKSFSCGICKKQFTRNSSLQTHMNIHLNVKPYVCNICDFRFNANPNLIRHKKNVHNMRFSNSSKGFVVKDNSILNESEDSSNNFNETPSSHTQKKVSVSLSDPIYQVNKNTKLTTYINKQRKLPEPVYNVHIAHPVKFKDLVQYETVVNYIESRR